MRTATMPIRLTAALVGASAMLVEGPTAAAAKDQPRYVSVELVTNFKNEEPSRTKRVQPVLEKSAIDALKRRHGIEVVESAEAKLVLIVRNLEEDPVAKRELAVMDYGVLIEVYTGGKKAGDKVVFCTEKGEAELVECAIEGIEAVLPYVPVEEPSTAGPDSPAPSQGGETKGEVDRVAPIGALGIAGAVVGAAGLATTIAGGVDLGRGEVIEAPTMSGFDNVTDYRPRGRALLGTGIGVLVVGAVLVGVDVGIRAKKRSSNRTAWFGINVRRGFAGASVQGRF